MIGNQRHRGPDGDADPFLDEFGDFDGEEAGARTNRRRRSEPQHVCDRSIEGAVWRRSARRPTNVATASIAIRPASVERSRTP